MEEEKWKPLEGFSNYLFSDMGNIKRISDGRIESTTLSGVPQYYYVHLVPDGGKRSLYRLHRLIAMAWIPKPDDPKMNMVDHINRDKLDNRVENLRWVCRSGNQKNTDKAYFAMYKGFWVHVRTFYKDNQQAYSYASQRKHLTDDLEELEQMRLSQDESEGYTKTVIWEGEERLLKDICDEHGRDYEIAYHRIWRQVSTVYGCVIYDKIPNVYYELDGAGGVKYQFSGKDEIAGYLGVTRSRVDESLPLCNGNIVELKRLISLYKPRDPRKLYTIDGVSKYREDWIRHYETSEVRVSTNISKYKIPFEQAVKLPVERVRKVSVNGEVMFVKDMWLMFGLDPKRANNKKSDLKITFKETLTKLGVDTTSIEISVL